jgi:hypothetical protein
MAENGKTIEQLLAELKGAHDALEAAKAEVSKANNRHTDALNVFNGITHKLDAAMAVLRRAAPEQTDWQKGA